jgi:hypothetical protein
MKDPSLMEDDISGENQESPTTESLPQNMSCRSPILFIAFNRPQTTQRVFDAIRRARPPRLYVAADGPRAGRAEELKKCEAVRGIATAVDWPCELRTLFRSDNLGCRRAVSAAITWFFESESEGIILEDDCLPDLSFFTFCDDLLDRFRQDERVMCITGDNFVADYWQPSESYYFSRYPSIWGWATWARAWRHYAAASGSLSARSVDRILKHALPDRPLVREFWRARIAEVRLGVVDTWDYDWVLTMFARGGVCCVPRENLVENIGFGEGATHTVASVCPAYVASAKTVAMPLMHPTEVQVSLVADQCTDDRIFGLSRVGVLRGLAWRVIGFFRLWGIFGIARRWARQGD